MREPARRGQLGSGLELECSAPREWPAALTTPAHRSPTSTAVTRTSWTAFRIPSFVDGPPRVERDSAQRERRARIRNDAGRQRRWVHKEGIES